MLKVVGMRDNYTCMKEDKRDLWKLKEPQVKRFAIFPGLKT